MNRCKPSHRFRTLIACHALALVAATVASPAVAQIPQTQNEAALGGRNFPTGTLRGKLVVTGAPEIEINGNAERLSPGARIRSQEHMLVTPASVTGQPLLVNYTRDAAGLVREVWILTPDEARAERAGIPSIWQKLWPFAISDSPRNNNLVPYDQLPRYGQ